MRSGLIRKLDEVGRIVIPKEIRKYLELKEGSPLEIGINESGEVVLKASQENMKLAEVIELVGTEIHNILNKNILIVINSEIFKSFGREVKGSVSASILHIMNEKKTYFACIKDKTTILPIFQELDIDYKNIAVVPMDICEDKACVIAFSDSETIEIHEVKFLELASKIIKGLIK